MTGRVWKLEWAVFAVTVKAGDGGGGGQMSLPPLQAQHLFHLIWSL